MLLALLLGVEQPRSIREGCAAKTALVADAVEEAGEVFCLRWTSACILQFDVVQFMSYNMHMCTEPTSRCQA
jgi:hypothetical protein